MKPCRFALFIFLSSALAWAGGFPSLHRTAQSVVGVYLQFDTAANEATIASMESEISSIMKPAGLHFAWREMVGRDNSEAFDDLVVLHFRGACDVSAFARASRDSHSISLADTSIVNGVVLPFSEIQCDRIRRYIDPLIRGEVGMDAALGRALGRVAAHEMYHIFVETKQHGQNGVARAYHRAEDLVAKEFTFDAPETERLKAYSERFLHGQSIAASR